ncbi:MAG: Bax inhibitor-1/YccA family protein [Planctomycetota bacterium]
MFNSGNPAMNENTFAMPYDRADAISRPEGMTVMGTVYKTMLLLLAVVASGTFTWNMAMSSGTIPGAWTFGGMIAGLVLALVIIFKPTTAPFLSPLYAVAQGLFLGGVSAFYEMNFGAGQSSGGVALNGIVIQAVGLTFGVTAAMLIAYATRIIRVTEKLRAGIIMAVGGVMLFYVVSIVLGLFGVDVPLLHSNGPLGIGISLVIVAIAAFSLLLDFDLIERGSAAGAPKYMEWYGAFGLMVTLIWLYLEILRLLAKLQSRD